MTGPTIAVVGGGSVAAAWLFHAVEALAALGGDAARGLRLRIHEPRARIGRGVAYADDLPSNLLNVTVAGMSIAGDDKAHFQRWLAAQGIRHAAGRPITGASFVPRALFGRYLEAVTAQALEAARALGVLVEHVPQAVTGLQRAPDGGWRVETADGQHRPADRVVLAIGNLASNSFAALRGQAGYADTPYPSLGLLDGIDRGAPVGILGTSLSAVDAIAGLVAQGQRGPIHAVSRNGRLPSVRGLLNPATALRPIFCATLQQARDEGRRIGLDTLAALLADELRAVPGGLDEDLHRLATELPDALDFLEAEIALARSRPRAWQSIGNALNDCVDLAWQVLDEPGRRRFDRDWRAVWMARRVSFPLENALLLRELLRAGRLQVHRGFAGVAPLPQGGFELRLTQDGGGTERRLQVQGLVNATSFSTDAAAALAEQPLLRSLIDAGLAVPDPDGGLRLDADTGALRRRDGQVEPTVTVLGSLAAGTYFWTNAMEVNARLAMGQARRAVAALAAAPGEVATVGARR